MGHLHVHVPDAIGWEKYMTLYYDRSSEEAWRGKFELHVGVGNPRAPRPLQYEMLPLRPCCAMIIFRYSLSILRLSPYICMHA